MDFVEVQAVALFPDFKFGNTLTMLVDAMRRRLVDACFIDLTRAFDTSSHSTYQSKVLTYVTDDRDLEGLLNIHLIVKKSFNMMRSGIKRILTSQ